MARTYKSKSIVSGLSVKDILNLDNDTFNKLGISDMRKVVGRLVSAGNKRLRTFEKAGDISPAVRQVMRSGGNFSTKGKDLNALRSEYVRAKNFLQARTGTRKGWTNVRKDTIKALKKQGVEVTEEQFDDLWKAYEKLKELDPEVANKKMRYTVLKEISNAMNDKSVTADEIATELHDKLDLIYEERAEIENETGGISDFFEL